MKSISLYVDKESSIHKIDPISKLSFVAFSILVPIILPSMAASFICLLLNMVVLLVAKVFNKTIRIYGLVLFLLMTVILIQGLFHPDNVTVLIKIGPVVFFEEGLLFALKITISVLTIVSTFMVLILTTKPSDLVESLVRKGLSPKLGYVFLSVFQIVPEMVATIDRITDAQRSRGMETEGKLSVRIKAFLPLLGPVVLSALINTKERALALEVRGFNSQYPKTYLFEEKRYAYSKVIQYGLLLLVVAAIGWRIIG